jgi:hypothetical protein
MAACGHDVTSPKVELTRLEPDLICNDQFPPGGVLVTVIGDGFTPMPLRAVEGPAQAELPQIALQRGRALDGMDAGGDPVVFSGVAGQSNADKLGWESEERMSLAFDESNRLEPGLYAVTVTNPDGKNAATLPIGLAVVPPPRVESVLPTSLCNGFQEQTFTVNGDHFIKIGEDVPTVEFEGSGAPPLPAEEMSDCVEVEGLSEPVQICRSITTTVPADSVEPGEYRVIVTNPKSARCASTDAVTVKVLDEGPVLFYADPSVVYNGINTRGTLYLTTVTGDFEVVVSPEGSPTDETPLDADLVAGRTNRINATFPADLAPGTYDITVRDDTGCSTTLHDGVVVTDELTLTVSAVLPPFGHEPEATAVQITGDTFEETPRGFLNPVGQASAVAIPLESLSFLDGSTLNAVVPRNTPAGFYDVVIVNPGGAVGLLQNGYRSLPEDTPPPVIVDVTPQSIVNATGQVITITGTGFSGATVSLSCQDAAGAPVAAPSVTTGTETCTATGCTLTATVNASALGNGSVCVVRVTNELAGDNDPYSDFSAIGVTGPSLNLENPRAAEPLLTARRALGSAAVKATSTQRFVYALGGDGGAVGSAMASVEYAPVDLFGRMNPFLANRESLSTERTFVATAQIGRYIYALGGNDGGGALATAERATVLSPEEIPVIEDVDLCLAGGREPCFGVADGDAGLPEGRYAYRVSALIDPADPENLGGETLASDPIILRLPDIQNRTIVVKVVWSPPEDPLGAPLSGIVGYRVYRTPADGVPARDEVLLAQIDDGAATEFIDDGTDPLGTAVPLPPGSTSAWQALPVLATAREAAGAFALRDPGDTDPSDGQTWYVYATLGRSGATAHGSYEFLPVTVLPNGKQTVASAWTEGATSATARAEHGTYVVDARTSPQITGDEVYVYLAGGLVGGSTTGVAEVASLGAGGQLGAFSAVSAMSPARAGFGNVTAGSGATTKLFVFGGLQANPTSNANAAELGVPPAISNWNNEGLQMTSARYLMGSSVQSAFIFLLGGTSGTGALSSTETVVW